MWVDVLVGAVLVGAGVPNNTTPQNTRPNQVLNARPENIELESQVVAQAGRLGSVTVATNMAGRGTDILLGGNPSLMARIKLKEALVRVCVCFGGGRGAGGG